MLIDILQLGYDGIVYGCILALGAVGVSMVYGILRFANFAHGDMMTLGAYLAYFMVVNLGWPIWLAIVPAAIGAAIICIIIDRLFYKRLRRIAPVILLISSFATALILRSLIQVIWGPDNQVYEKGITIPYHYAGLVFTPTSLWVIVGAVVAVGLTHYFLSHTKMGKAMRAMSDNMDLALVSGIPSERVIVWVWLVGGTLAAVAGILLGMDTQLHPTMGFRALLPIFAAAIVGGIGRPYGAIAGALVISILMHLSTLVLDPAYQPAVAFAVMILVLIFRPEGIFKGRA